MKPIKLDAAKLLGMKLTGTTDARVGSKSGRKIGSKGGAKSI